MSDLFTRLSQRAHGHRPTIAPRQPTRFESSAEPAESDAAPGVDSAAEGLAAPPQSADGARLAIPPSPGVRVDTPAGGVGNDTASTAGITAGAPVDFPAPRSVGGRPEPQPSVGARGAAAKAEETVADVERRRIRPAAVDPPAPRRENSRRTAVFGDLAEPDVNISIGRIEIRSAPPVSPAPPMPAAPPGDSTDGESPGALSLTAYLRGDGRGSR